MALIRTIESSIIAGLLLLSLLIVGCGVMESEAERQKYITADEAIFGDSEHIYLYQLFGDITMNEGLDMIGDILDSLNAAVIYGDVKDADYEVISAIIKKIRDYVANMEGNTVEEESKFVSILKMMHKYHVGDLVTNLIGATGPDVLVENIYPILEYLVDMDFGDAKGIPLEGSGVSLDISDEEIEDLKNALNRILDSKGPYKGVYDTSDVLIDLVKKRESEKKDKITVGDIRNAIDKLTAGIKDSDFDLKPVVNAIVELWNEEKEVLGDDSDKLLYSLGQLMTDRTRSFGPDGWNWTNKEMTDFERILYCLQDLLNPVVQDRDVLKNFLQNSIDGTALLEGADSLHGILQGLSSVNTEDLKEIDTAIYKYLFMNNIYGEPRGGGTDVNMSVTRAFLYLLSALYPLGSQDMGNLLNVVVTEEPQVPEKSNLIEWLVGLMVLGCYEYPSYHNYIDGPDPNPLEGIDWAFYEQDIRFQIEVFGYPLTLMKFDGLYGLLGILLENDFLLGLVGSVAGALTDPLPAMPEFIGGTGEKYTAGDKHKLFAIAAPLLKHYYDQGRALDLVEMATHINEINPSTYKTLAWNGNNATFRKGTSQSNRLGHVLENLEGRFGHGLIYYGFRGDSEDEHDHNGDLLDPVLGMTIRILQKLDSTIYEDGNLIDYLFSGNEDSGEGDGEGLDFDVLFAEDGAVDKLYNFLSENHDVLVKVIEPIGRIILALHSDLGNFEGIFDALINGEILNVLKDELYDAEGQEALKSVTRAVLELLDITDEDLLDAIIDMLDAVLTSSGTLIDDIKKLLPILNDQFENLPTDKDSMSEGMGSILDIIIEEMEIDSPLTINLKILGYRVMNLFDEIHNMNGKIIDDTPIFDALDFLLGKDGMYDFTSILDMLRAVMAPDDNLKMLSATNIVRESALLREIKEENIELILSLRFIRSLFISYDGKDSIVLMVLKPIYLETNYGMPVDMNGVIGDLADVMDGLHIVPGTKFYDQILGLLDFAVESLK